MTLLRRLIDERVVVAAILLNAIALFVGDYRSEGPRGFWFAVDYGCVVYFVIETVIKLVAEGWRGYWRSNWNRFDFIIIAISTPALLSTRL